MISEPVSPEEGAEEEVVEEVEVALQLLPADFAVVVG